MDYASRVFLKKYMQTIARCGVDDEKMLKFLRILRRKFELLLFFLDICI